jgi:hypothetical protein
MVRVIMKQDISGPRGDGRAWPPAGVEFEVDEAEARLLTLTGGSSNVPLAVYAEKRTETGDAPESRAETRDETREAVVPETRVTSGRPGAGKGRPAPIVRK